MDQHRADKKADLPPDVQDDEMIGNLVRLGADADVIERAVREGKIKSERDEFFAAMER